MPGILGVRNFKRAHWGGLILPTMSRVCSGKTPRLELASSTGWCMPMCGTWAGGMWGPLSAFPLSPASSHCNAFGAWVLRLLRTGSRYVTFSNIMSTVMQSAFYSFLEIHKPPSEIQGRRYSPCFRTGGGPRSPCRATWDVEDAGTLCRKWDLYLTYLPLATGVLVLRASPMHLLLSTEEALGINEEDACWAGWPILSSFPGFSILSFKAVSPVFTN